MSDLISLAKALSDETRVRVVTVLRGRELCVCELCDALEFSQSTLSTHLNVIRQSGLVQTRKEGKWIYYSLVPELAKATDGLFAFYRKTLETDKRIERDAKRIEQRLKIREEGKCLKGFSELK